MTNPDNNYKHTDLTEKIIGCAYQVYNALGAGFIGKQGDSSLVSLIVAHRHATGAKLSFQNATKNTTIKRTLQMNNAYGKILL